MGTRPNDWCQDSGFTASIWLGVGAVLLIGMAKSFFVQWPWNLFAVYTGRLVVQFCWAAGFRNGPLPRWSCWT